MKTVTAQFNDTLKQPGTFPRREVYYKRRKWNQSTNKYEWETNWTQLPEAKIVSVPPITWQLDTVTLNDFKVSNVTLQLENLRNQWNPQNIEGMFAPDANSPVFGYEFYFTKFQVRAGLNYTTTTSESVAIFTGVATDYTIDSVSGHIQITVAGEEQILINADAEQVSTTYTNEIIGTGDGTTKDFFTAHVAVGIVVEVSDNGATKRAGVDYTLSQLNEQTLSAKISFPVAPLVGHTLRCTYRSWFTSQKFETLVGDLLTQAGIPAPNQQVQSVTFPGNVTNRHTWQTQSDWDGGSSLTNIDTTTLVDSIQVTKTMTETWNSSVSGWSSAQTGGASFSHISGGNQASGPVGSNIAVWYPSTTTCGTWTIPFSYTQANGSASTSLTFIFMAVSAPAGTFLRANNSYQVVVGPTSMDMQYIDGGGSFHYIGNHSFTGPSYGSHVLTINRRPDGTMTVSLDGTLYITANDTNVTTSNYFAYNILATGLVSGTWTATFLDNSTFAVAASTDGIGTWISSAVDFGFTPSAWNQFLYSDIPNGGTTTYYTSTSSNNITYDPYVVVPVSGIPNSTLARYVKVKIVIDSTGGYPTVALASVGAITQSTVISVANFTGMSCYDAISQLGTFANYEYGFDANENFFFRARPTTNVPVFFISQKDYIQKVTSMASGYDRVYSIVRAVYGSYIVEVADDGLNFTSPAARISKVRVEINGGTLLALSDADVATGVANTFLQYYRTPKRRVKLITKILPQLDLSDIIQATDMDTYGPSPNWYLGDNSQNLNPSGSTPLTLYGEGEQTIYNFIGKIIGIRYDTDNWMSEIDLEEIPQ